jgi:TRAP-type C4-dicarboxylate transport system substrate-binding protein
MKRFAVVTFVASLICLIFTAAAMAGPVSFKFATFIPPNEPGAAVGLWIEKELNQKSNGAVKAKYFHSRQMGSAIEIVKKVRMGTLQAAFCPSTYAPDLDPKFGIATLAYCMDSYAKWEALLKDQALRDELFLALQSKGLRCLDFTYYGIYGLATTKPVNNLADLKTMKMRTTQARYPLAFWHALGVKPVTMAWGDVFPALKQGVVDGLDQTRNVVRLRLTDVTKYFTETNHTVGLFYLLVNDKWWSGLDPKVRAVIAGSIAQNCAKSRQQSMELTKQAVPELKKKGMTVITLSPGEMKKFKESQAKVWKQFESEIGKDWLEKIAAFSAKH